MEVANIEADLCNYTKFHNYIEHDYQVLVRYENIHAYKIIVLRLDTANGWTDDLSVLVNYTDSDTNEIIHIGQSASVSKKEMLVERESITFYPSDTPIKYLPSYKLVPFPEPIKISRDDFNTKFSSDIVSLPRELYAFGIENNTVFLYNDFCADYFDIIKVASHIIRTALTFTRYRKFYFIISVHDGYLEYHYYSNRCEPYKVEVDEFKDKVSIMLDNPHIYPEWHSKRYILGMSNWRGVPYTIDVPDRHFFYCNLYNDFRSFHRGIPFSTKINKIVYAGRIGRGTKYNFLTRRDIDTDQRTYFMSNNVPKTNIVCSTNGELQTEDMIQYKYILDIDGHACTWDGTAWKLNSGSVIFKTNSIWRQWFYDDYKPWVHYIPVNDDFSDIDDKYAWCESHQEECKRIISNAKKLFQKVYRLDSIFKYTIKAIEMIV